MMASAMLPDPRTQIFMDEIISDAVVELARRVDVTRNGRTPRILLDNRCMFDATELINAVRTAKSKRRDTCSNDSSMF